jgi:hypothetical protein
MRVAAPLLAIGSGAIAAVLAFLLGVPGQGLFIWTSLGFGALAGAAVGTWTGAVLTVSGAAAAAILIIVIGQTGGLIAVVVAVLGGLLALGYLGGWVVRRVVVGRGAALREPAVIFAIVALAVVSAGYWWIARELARNPP